ncbi:MAG: M36 family metallopeptidase [Polyangiaceae bacterium]|nr:M36 family metallopeptidase [Polyangiaceae bacterium]
MRKQLLRSAPLLFLLLSGCVAPTGDEATPQKTTSNGTRIFRSETGPLTPPSVEAPSVIASDFLVTRGLVKSLDGLSIEPYSNGRFTHVKVAQTIDGLRVHGAYAKIALSEDGEIVQVMERLAKGEVELEETEISPRQALDAAMAHLNYTEATSEVEVQGNITRFAPTGELYNPPTVEQVAYLDDDGTAHAGFLVETWSLKGNQLNHTIVGAAGEIVSVENRTANDSYKVFVEDPGKGAQTVVNGPGAGNTESPSGWLSGSQKTTLIAGNNARAYLDASPANNSPDSGGTTVSNGNFLTTADLAQQPSITANKAVAVQNLFYLNNVLHDVLYSHGFTESNGNFQTNNFGKGGAGNDRVNAEAQDGGGLDNANFATPSDGSSPRMQMYLWSGTMPNGATVVSGLTYGTYGSTFGPALTTNGVTGALAVYNDNTGVTSDACEAAASGSLTGKVAIVDRGTCTFTVKVKNAQLAGAIGVLIANNVPDGAFGPSGTDNTISIPSGMVTQSDGTTLKGLAGTSANLKKNPVTPLKLDGDLDSDIVYHEYGHGLSWRMIGGMSGKLAGAVGEGASDVLAYLLNGDDRVGEYAYGIPGGIRRYPYTNYPLTYSDVTGAEVHNDGEVYAGAMWRVLENYLAAGLTSTQLLDDFVKGMDFTPSTPAFEDMRDGMLQATAGTGRECHIWHGFAASGIGVGADGVATSSSVTITESFTLPTACQ